MRAETPLTFRDVDGLARQAANGGLDCAPLSTEFRAEHFGPLVELAALVSAKRLPRWIVSGHLQPGRGDILLRAVIDCTSPAVARNGDTSGVFSLTNPSETAFISFNLAARKAAEASGFSNSTAAQFGAALMELRNNVSDHSLATATGVLFFCSDARWFEFGVSDRGQGVLSSLRTFPDYAGLADHGDALRLAVSEGGTRYGPGARHGYGFRPIFLGLAGYHGYLRWRSGDHVLLIDARNPNASSGDVFQKTMFDGLTFSALCSVN